MTKEILAKDNRSYFFNQGITSRQIDELVSHSGNDEVVQKHTSDKRRFRDLEAYFDWLEKGKRLYTLSGQKGSLAGVVWFGSESLPQASYIIDIQRQEYFTTFAIRVYGEARGSGVAYPFMMKSINNFQDSLMNPVGIWLAVREDNITAIKLYNKFGFREVARDVERRKLLMITDL